MAGKGYNSKVIYDDIEYYICESCKGRGLKSLRTPLGTFLEVFCQDCQGRGYLDWVEKIVGVKKK